MQIFYVFNLNCQVVRNSRYYLRMILHELKRASGIYKCTGDICLNI
jgi:hypothetical protein